MREKKLQSLEEFQAEKRRIHKLRLDAMKPHPNGIACPKCGEELWDTNPMEVCLSNPPQKAIHCPACGYSSYRLH